MKKGCVIGGVLLILVAIAAMWLVGKYNTLVGLEEDVENAWSKVESAYQRRADLIGNLVATVQEAANFEKGTLTEVIEARANANSVKLNVDELNEANMAKFQEAQESLNQSFLGRLNFLNENYPQLTATQQFRDLSAQIEGTENRIKIERDKYNDTATVYDKAVRKFPMNLVAGFFNFEEKALFKSQAGAENAPDVRNEFGKGE